MCWNHPFNTFNLDASRVLFFSKRRIEIEVAIAVIDKSMTIDVSTRAWGRGPTEYWEKVRRFSV